MTDPRMAAAPVVLAIPTQNKRLADLRADLDLVEITEANVAAAGAAMKSTDSTADLQPDVSTTQVGTTYSLVSADDCTTIVCSNAALVTVTIPTNATLALRVGFRALLVAAGAGGLTASTTGITLIGSAPNKTIAQNKGLYVEKTATDTWIVIGGTSA